MIEQRRALLKKHYIAKRVGDFAEMREIRLDILRFNMRNRKNPKAAISPETLERSLKANEATTKAMHNGVLISPMMRTYLEEYAYGGY